MSLRLLGWVVALALPLALSPTVAMAGGEANLLYGQKDVDDVDDELDVIGVLLSFGGDWPVAIAVDILSGDVSETYSYYGYTGDVELDVLELQVGVRKTFRDGQKLQPYVGGGLTYADGEITANVVGFPPLSDSDSGIGFWGGGGVIYRIGDRFNIGADVRHSEVEIEFLGIDAEVGGTQYGVMFGFRWGE